MPVEHSPLHQASLCGWGWVSTKRDDRETGHGLNVTRLNGSDGDAVGGVCVCGCVREGRKRLVCAHSIN